MIAFVAIGRNEGERLKRCLASLPRGRIVYVDSGSSDPSAAAAKALGADVVALEPPFTAARARNAGFRRAIERWPDADPILFIDGDCELSAGFPAAAIAELDANPTVAVVVGRVRERAPDATVYNRLCALEWAGPLGDIRASGGIFAARRSAFEAVGGFNPGVIAAEDDELCLRLRNAGWKIRRIAAEMCVHDAGMTQFSQWWRRSVRAGHAYAQLGALHADYFGPERARAIGWGFALPAAAIGAAALTQGWSLLALGLYPASFIRTRANLMRSGTAPADAGLYAAFLTLSKFPNLLGIMSYWRKRLTGGAIAIVEYK